MFQVFNSFSGCLYNCVLAQLLVVTGRSWTLPWVNRLFGQILFKIRPKNDAKTSIWSLIFFLIIFISMRHIMNINTDNIVIFFCVVLNL